MGTLNIQKIKKEIEFIVIISSAIYAVTIEFSLYTTFIIVFFLVIFLVNRNFNWKSVPSKISSKDEYDILFMNYLKYVRVFSISLSLLFLILNIAITEAHKRFPDWQKQYIIENLTKSDAVEQLKAQEIPIRSIQDDSFFTCAKQDTPQLSISTPKTLLIYNNERITTNLLMIAKSKMNNYSLALAVLMSVITAFCIPMDHVFLLNILMRQNKLK